MSANAPSVLSDIDRCRILLIDLCFRTFRIAVKRAMDLNSMPLNQDVRTSFHNVYTERKRWIKSHTGYRLIRKMEENSLKQHENKDEARIIPDWDYQAAEERVVDSFLRSPFYYNYWLVGFLESLGVNTTHLLLFSELTSDVASYHSREQPFDCSMYSTLSPYMRVFLQRVWLISDYRKLLSPIELLPGSQRVRVRRGGSYNDFQVTETQWRIIRILVQNTGRAISTRDLNLYDETLIVGARYDRIIRDLPDGIRQYIKGKKGTGYWVDVTSP